MTPPYTIMSEPRMSAALFRQVLERGTSAGVSSAAPDADHLYDIFVQAGVDPAVGLAFSAHENQYGCTGLTKQYGLKNWGNVRSPMDPGRAAEEFNLPRADAQLVKVLDFGKRGKFVQYPTWQLAVADWCLRMRDRYVKEKDLDTVEKAVPTYAPTSDGNQPKAYIDHVNKLVSDWMAADSKAGSTMKVYDVRGEFQGGFTDRRKITDQIVVHHAAALYKTPTGIDDCRAVKKYHTDPEPKGRGWPGIGYHWGLAEEIEGGPIALYQFSDPMLMRAGVALQNHHIFNICCLTNFGNAMPGQKWIDALVEAGKLAKEMFPSASFVGHRDIALPGYKTECPGNAWPQWKGTLVARILEGQDWAGRWGPYFPYNDTFGIEQEWRYQWGKGRKLGKAVSNEVPLLSRPGAVYRAFEFGTIVWSLQAVETYGGIAP